LYQFCLSFISVLRTSDQCWLNTCEVRLDHKLIKSYARRVPAEALGPRHTWEAAVASHAWRQRV